jgi:NAD(P)-dependent dehydrogenase (short-subunit alcohol dehydrogenase family)
MRKRKDKMISTFKDSIVILTGGASGIGQALGEQIAQLGAEMVVLADIDLERAKEVASCCRKQGYQVRAVGLDVTEASDIQDLVAETYSEYGRLDFMFNNAGIALCGEVRDLELVHWRRVIDTNLWGVIYGSIAAYRVMVTQKRGHIINTASLGGLIPEPMATAYAATKHAVVGLSTSLRAEAADLGINVSVVCPGFVQTRALDSATYVGIRKRDAIEELSSMQSMEAARCAQTILKGVACNKAIITDSAITRLLWRLHRLSPGILEPFLKKGVADMRVLRVSQEMTQ